MRKMFYPKLAWTGICKNKKLYIPYIITCIGMVMMHYIISFLSDNPTIKAAKGGSYTSMAMGLGASVIAVFACIFLFYTNSFLNKRRKKEFGLYNILGMEKKNIGYVLICESIIISLISLSVGLVMGIIFAKFSELCMLNLLQEKVNTVLYIDAKAIGDTVSVFVCVFALLLVYTLFQIKASKPIELLNSEKSGEKPPKVKWLLAIEGLVILSVAYYMALTIENPLLAFQNFFIAVLLVIGATYILFVSGSVAICRLLQKNKKYYYQTNHFVAVSSMAYRMKRNGVGLASICILCTMILIILSGTACLYFGTEDTLRDMYPRNIIIDGEVTDMSSYKEYQSDHVREAIEDIVTQAGEESVDVLDFTSAYALGTIENGEILVKNMRTIQLAKLWQVYVMPLADYNEMMGTNETLQKNEVIVYADNYDEIEDSISFGGNTYQIKSYAPKLAIENMGALQIVSSVYIFTPNFEEIKNQLYQYKDEENNMIVNVAWYYGFDLTCSDEKQMEIHSRICQYLDTDALSDVGIFAEFSSECVAMHRDSFFGMYGNLLFLGILLAIVFVVAAVLIIYYKQISEGYEDQSRFEIMQKVGMSKDEIKRSINSQVLTVFFLPIVVAGIHLSFAFPMVEKLLAMLNFYQREMLITVTILCFLGFGVVYLGIYFLTSKAYYGIVSGQREK